MNRPCINFIQMIDGLKGKVVIVTGGAHGIGKAYCRGFAETGARVVIADIDEAAAERAVGEISEAIGIAVGAIHESPLHAGMSVRFIEAFFSRPRSALRKASRGGDEEPSPTDACSAICLSFRALARFSSNIGPT